MQKYNALGLAAIILIHATVVGLATWGMLHETIARLVALVP